MADKLALEAPTRDLPDDNRFVTWTDWQGYLKFSDLLSDRRLRITYDRGTLEIMAPSPRHENKKSVLGRLVECLMTERGIDFRGGGATTLRREDLDRGLEPDECYWIDHWQAFGDDYDLSRDPPPDVVIEVEVSRTAVSRMGIYQALGVGEVWRFRIRDRLEFWCRDEAGEYVRRERSPHFPDLDPQELVDLVQRGRTISTSQLLREARKRFGQ